MVFPKISLRNHTCFSGGENTPEEMILSAIEAGAQAIGISYFAAASFSLQPDTRHKELSAFRREIAELAEKYCEKITVLLGEERDFYADPLFLPCDYTVGFVHHLVADDGAVCPLDRSAEQILSDVKAHFGGSMERLIRRYYETVALLVKRTRCDLIADFDFLQTFNLRNRLFDPSLPFYRTAVLEAMESLIREDVAFEIRLCGGTDGNPIRFSPAQDIVRWLAAHGAKLFLSANAYRKEALFAGFSECTQFAKACGAGGFAFPFGKKRKTIPMGRES